MDLLCLCFDFLFDGGFDLSFSLQSLIGGLNDFLLGICERLKFFVLVDLVGQFVVCVQLSFRLNLNDIFCLSGGFRFGMKQLFIFVLFRL
jgi:hypothetical protein